MYEVHFIVLMMTIFDIYGRSLYIYLYRMLIVVFDINDSSHFRLQFGAVIDKVLTMCTKTNTQTVINNISYYEVQVYVQIQYGMVYCDMFLIYVYIISFRYI